MVKANDLRNKGSKRKSSFGAGGGSRNTKRKEIK